MRPQGLRENTPLHVIKALRKMKTCPAAIKSIVYMGSHGGPQTIIQFHKDIQIQFHKDIQIYGMWEALLYIEGMEPQYFTPTTASKAVAKLQQSIKLPTNETNINDPMKG